MEYDTLDSGTGFFKNNTVHQNRKLRIAYLTTEYPSVSHTFIRRELREMARRGHDIFRFALRPSRTPLKDPIDLQEAKKTIYCLTQPALRHFLSLFHIIAIHPLRFTKALYITLKMNYLSERGILKHIAYLLEASTLFCLLRKHKIQHIHVHFGTHVTTIARLIHCFGGPPYSFTVHGPDEFDSPVGFDLKGKIADAAFVVAITDFCSSQLRRFSSISDWKKIHIVHCTVGEDFFDAALPIDPNSNTFVSIGRLAPQKGQLVLIEAFERLINSGHKAHLIFVGDGKLRKVLESRIKKAGIGKNITITGYVSESEVRHYLAMGRVMVLPSYAEGLPMVIMEAFAVGRPVISTYIAGIPELVRPGENGWLVSAANTDQLVSSMVEALTTSSRNLAKMAVSGNRLTRKRHHTTTEGDKLESLLLKYVK